MVKKRRRQQTIIFLFICCVVISCIFVSLLFWYLPNYTMEPVYNMTDELDKDKMNFVYNDEIIVWVNPPVERDGTIYLPVDFVKEKIDPYIFWDEPLGLLTITTEDKVMRMRTEELNYYVNNQPMTLNLPVYDIDGVAYLPSDLLMELYDVEIAYHDMYQIVTIDSTEIPREYGDVAKDCAFRYAPDKESPIAEKLKVGEQVMIFSDAPQTQGTPYVYVRSDRGLMGYVESKYIENINTVEPVQKEAVDTSVPNPIDGKIVMLWDQVFNVEANANELRREAIPGVNVLSPTWFSFDEGTKNGDIINIADKEYVDWAHENGYQVWALITDNFDYDVNHAILSNTETREHVIKQLLAFVSMYDLDGINVDFEAINDEDVGYYLQFLRELKPLMQEQGVVLSIDLYVPLYTKHYNRTELAKTVDYICVMAYDEYYRYSDVSGPNASLPFVEEGITATLEEVPKEKVIMGIPFWVRVWREEPLADGTVAVESKDYDMASAYELFAAQGVEFTWQEEVGTYYAEYTTTEDGVEVTYKAWFEDERSIEQKMKVFEKYDLAGVAFWKRGLEKPEVWDVIRASL